VFFGENLGDEFHESVAMDKNEADLLIMIGSSLKVSFSSQGLEFVDTLLAFLSLCIIGPSCRPYPIFCQPKDSTNSYKPRGPVPLNSRRSTIR